MRFELSVHRRCHASVMGWSQNGQLWRAKLRPGSSSSSAHHAHHPGRALHEVGNTVLSIASNAGLMIERDHFQHWKRSISITYLTISGDMCPQGISNAHHVATLAGLEARRGDGTQTDSKMVSTPVHRVSEEAVWGTERPSLLVVVRNRCTALDRGRRFHCRRWHHLPEERF